MKGNSHAQYTYGALLDIDMNQHEDAMKWYLKAAAQGDAIAMNNLAIALLQRQGRGAKQVYGCGVVLERGVEGGS